MSAETTQGPAATAAQVPSQARDGARGATEPGEWWPSRFGAEDQAGMLNLVTDAKRREAAALVREGRMFDLGRVLDEHVPVFPGRHFRQTLVTTAHHVNVRGSEREPAGVTVGGPSGLGDNHVNWVIELVSATTQLGTHLDMLNHLQIGDRGYNGWTVAELAEPWGTNRLGAETAPQVVTRGWLADVAAVRGVHALGGGDVVTVADVEKALDGATPEPGDALLFHTGWGGRWADPAGYLDGEPGPGMAVARWLVDHGVALTGCDTWSYGPVPAEDPRRPFAVPQWLNVHHGVFVVENLDTSGLAAAGVRCFALVLTHPKLRGATAGWTSPLALI